MRNTGLKRSTTLVAAALVSLALAGPAGALESTDEAVAASTSFDLEQRLAELEQSIEAIGARFDSAAAPRTSVIEARPFVETYFEELDRYGD